MYTCPGWERALVELRHHPHQVLADRQQRRTEASVRAAHQRSNAAVEAEPHGYRGAAALVRLRPRRDEMLDKTDTGWAPWYIVDTNDKRRGRLNCITHLLRQIPYEQLEHEPVKLPNRSKKNEYDDEAALEPRRWVPEVY